MSKPLVDRIPFAKITAVMAATFVVSLGLCGLSGMLSSPFGPSPSEEFGGGFVGNMGLILFLLSALGLVVTLIAWPLVAVFGDKSNDPQRLFDDKQNPDKKS
jgi:hypothetical protein